MVIFDDDISDLCHKWLIEPDVAGETGGAANDHAANIAASDVAGMTPSAIKSGRARDPR